MKRTAQRVLIGVTGLLCLLILSDAVPLLRGPAPETPLWYWPYLLRPVARWWWSLLAAVGMAGWLMLWLANRPKIGIKTGLSVLMGLHLALQLGFVYADASRTWLPAHEAVWAELLDRTLPPLTSGYFWDAAQVDNLPDLLRHYPEQMPLFESEHTRTHPPGLLVLNWLTLRGLENRPNLTTPIAHHNNTLRCTDLWLINHPPHVSAALLIWSLLPLFAATLAIPAAYQLATTLNGSSATPRLAAALVATLPALLVFAPKVDQIFAPIALLLLAATLTLRPVKTPHLARALGIGCGLGLLTFLSIGNAVLALPIGLLLLREFVEQDASTTQVDWSSKLFAVVQHLIAIALGTLLPWIAFWLWYGPAPWAIVGEGLAQHYELVTTKRPYGVWLLWNLVDVLTFASPLLLLGIGWQMRQFWRDCILSRQSVFALALLGLILLLDLSGSARGEVGRIWLFLFALLAVSAAEALEQLRIRHLAPLLMLAVSLSIGLAWRTVRPVIVVSTPPPAHEFSPEMRHDTSLSNEVVLRGSTVEQSAETLSVSLLWRANGATNYPYTAFVHVLDSQGKLVAQQDRWPANGQWPSTCWRAGEMVHDAYTLDLAPLADGSYQVFVGMYHRETLERVGEAVEIGQIER
ncbi:MAG: hypothetical protein ACPG8W_15860 [Candidatus Promineifilaceae bacterium]